LKIGEWITGPDGASEVTIDNRYFSVVISAGKNWDCRLARTSHNVIFTTAAAIVDLWWSTKRSFSWNNTRFRRFTKQGKTNLKKLKYSGLINNSLETYISQSELKNIFTL
jgi:hypothetical protein